MPTESQIKLDEANAARAEVWQAVEQARADAERIRTALFSTQLRARGTDPAAHLELSKLHADYAGALKTLQPLESALAAWDATIVRVQALATQS